MKFLAGVGSVVLALGLAYPAVAVDEGIPLETEQLETSDLSASPLQRAIAPDVPKRIFAGVHAQFGAGQSVFLPAGGDRPARIVTVSPFTSAAPVIDFPSGIATVFPVTGFSGLGGVTASPGATSASGTLFFSETVGRRIAVYDIATAKFVKRLPVPGDQPYQIAYRETSDGSGGTLFVTHTTTGTITGIDRETGEVVLSTNIPGTYLSGITLAADANSGANSGSLLLTDRGAKGNIYRLDIATGAVTDTYRVFDPMTGFDGSQDRVIHLLPGSEPGSERVLVNNQAAGKIVTYDLATQRITAEYAASPAAQSTLGVGAVGYVPGEAPGQGRVLGFLGTGEINVVDESSGDLTQTIRSLGHPAGGIGFIPHAPGSVEGEVFLADRLAPKIHVYDTVTRQLNREIALPRSNGAVSVSEGAAPKLVTAWPEGPVEIRDPVSGVVQQTLTMRATGLGRVPEQSQIIVTDATAKTLTVVSTDDGSVLATHPLSSPAGEISAGEWNGESVFAIPYTSTNTLELRNRETFEVVDTISTGFTQPTAVSLVGGNRLVGVQRDGVFRMYDRAAQGVVAAVRSGFAGVGVLALPNADTGGLRIYASDSTMGLAITNAGGIALNPETLPDGLVGEAYAQELDATGTPLPTLEITAGSLPLGLSFDESTGIISGEPTATGVYSFTVTAANGVADSVSREYTVTIGAPPFITTETVPEAQAGVHYSTVIESDGYPAPTFDVSEGSLPSGLTLNPVTGEISGTAVENEAAVFSITATNTFGSHTREYSYAVTGGASVAAEAAAEASASASASTAGSAATGEQNGTTAAATGTQNGTTASAAATGASSDAAADGTPRLERTGGAAALLPALAGFVSLAVGAYAMWTQRRRRAAAAGIDVGAELS